VPHIRQELTMSDTTRAIVVKRPGGPQVLEWSEIPLARPKPGEVLIRHAAIGLNFIDTYHRTGFYALPLPFVPGLEAAGIVEEIGADVRDLAVGDRIAYATAPVGAYSERRTIPAERVVKLPAEVSDEVAAAVMLKGMTARMLLRAVFRVEKGHRVLVHAAAGGVGSLLVPWARSLGARVIAVVGGDDKAARAKELGAEDVIVTAREKIAGRVRSITDGQGVHVAYDSVGKDTIDASLESLGTRGMLVTFGQSSGAVPPFDVLKLTRKSLYVTRPSVTEYTAARADLVASAAEVFDALRRRIIESPVEQRYPLAEARRAHEDLESRRTRGSSVLLP
jgi:NADPH2:quinone reductase